jgi:hypothetical protein
MTHDSPDDAPLAAAALLPALALPGGPDGVCRVGALPCPAGLCLSVRSAALRFIRATSAVGIGPKARVVRVVRSLGSANGKKPAAVPAAKLRAIAATDLVDAGGTAVPSVDSAGGASNGLAVPFVVTALLAPVTP